MPAPRTTDPIAIGIDIGGSGVKGAAVDLATGDLVGDRGLEPTPNPSTPSAVAEVVAAIASRITADRPVGVTFPGVVRAGIVETAANVDRSWVGVDANDLFSRHLGRPVVVLNDADAAGVAEMAFGAGRDRGGVVMMITLGTGIGSALFVDGRLVPNTEFGHIIVAGEDGEKLAAASVRTAQGLSWETWAERLNACLARLECLIAPDLIILGGGISRDHVEFLPRLQAHAELVPAQLFNDAGIVGAALATARGAQHPPSRRHRCAGARGRRRDHTPPRAGALPLRVRPRGRGRGLAPRQRGRLLAPGPDRERARQEPGARGLLRSRLGLRRRPLDDRSRGRRGRSRPGPDVRPLRPLQLAWGGGLCRPDAVRDAPRVRRPSGEDG